MNGNERLLTVLDNKTPDSIPTFEWFVDENVGQKMTGSSDMLDIIEDLDIDGINVRADYDKQFSDDIHYTDEWGAKKQLSGDAIAGTLESPLKDITKHMEYKFPDLGSTTRFKSVERAVERFGDSRGIILNLRDGFSDMRDILGYEEALVGMLLEPQAFADLLDRVVDYNLELAAIAAKRYGLKIIATTDDIANANGLIIDPDTYHGIIGPRFKRVFEGYRELGYKSIKHCDGDISSIIDFWVECGIDCIDPVDPSAGHELADFKAKYGDRICLKGNVDCKELLSNGSTEEVENAVKKCIEDAGRNGGYILSSSNTIHRGVKPENYRAMLDALRKYGKYSD